LQKKIKKIEFKAAFSGQIISELEKGNFVNIFLGL